MQNYNSRDEATPNISVYKSRPEVNDVWSQASEQYQNVFDYLVERFPDNTEIPLYAFPTPPDLGYFNGVTIKDKNRNNLRSTPDVGDTTTTMEPQFPNNEGTIKNMNRNNLRSTPNVGYTTTPWVSHLPAYTTTNWRIPTLRIIPQTTPWPFDLPPQSPQTTLSFFDMPSQYVRLCKVNGQVNIDIIDNACYKIKELSLPHILSYDSRAHFNRELDKYCLVRREAFTERISPFCKHKDKLAQYIGSYVSDRQEYYRYAEILLNEIQLHMESELKSINFQILTDTDIKMSDEILMTESQTNIRLFQIPLFQIKAPTLT